MQDVINKLILDLMSKNPYGLLGRNKKGSRRKKSTSKRKKSLKVVKDKKY